MARYGKGTKKIYEGKLTISNHKEVTVNGQPLDLALHVENTSPSGFNWGYGGAGPAQLAIAILADAFDDEVAGRWYCVLNEMTRQLPQKSGWVMTEQDLYTIFLGYRVNHKCPEAVEAIRHYFTDEPMR